MHRHACRPSILNMSKDYPSLVFRKQLIFTTHNYRLHYGLTLSLIKSRRFLEMLKTTPKTIAPRSRYYYYYY